MRIVTEIGDGRESQRGIHFPVSLPRTYLSMFSPYGMSGDILLRHEGIPTVSADCPSIILYYFSSLPVSLPPSCVTFTALGLHLPNKTLALILGWSSIFLENIG